MCEYTEGCTLSDDALALDLWAQLKTGRVQSEHSVECQRHHLLAAVVVHAGMGRVLVTPHVEIAKAMVPGLVKPTLFLGRKPVGGVGYSGYTHIHAGAVPETDWKRGSVTYLRCRCGTSTLDEGMIIDAVAGE